MDATGQLLALHGAAHESATGARPAPSFGPPDLSLIICTLDEAAAIGGVLREATAMLQGFSHEIIVVDDSTDEATADVVRAFGREDARIRLLRRTDARGLASAVIAGWDASRGRHLAVCDGDGQHDLSLLPQMLRILEGGQADLVAASRYIHGDTGLSGARDAMSRAATGVTSGLLGAGLSDPLSGFFAITRRTFEAARPKLSGVGFKILVDVAWSTPRRPRTRELPAALRARVGGASKLDFRIMADLAALLVEKRTGGLLSSRFVLFGAVGVTGVAVHMAALQLLRGVLPFAGAQAGAILVAMTTNFLLNNALTFRDMRLRGGAFWRGLLTFYAACLAGGIVSEIWASLAYHAGAHWALAGASGALIGGLCNYYASRRATWRAVSPANRTNPLAAALVRVQDK